MSLNGVFWAHFLRQDAETIGEKQTGGVGNTAVWGGGWRNDNPLIFLVGFGFGGVTIWKLNVWMTVIRFKVVSEDGFSPPEPTHAWHVEWWWRGDNWSGTNENWGSFRRCVKFGWGKKNNYCWLKSVGSLTRCHQRIYNFEKNFLLLPLNLKKTKYAIVVDAWKNSP